ncbi:MAG TPA: type II secretion system minor pseudopilin GspK [Verrucomicrobiae bacterium]|nr:type II secretion system minor pseudopilin GspK [Verrucomicrobiae bacterium]
MRNQRGIALVMALLVCALLVAAVTEFIHEVFVETSLHRSRLQGEQASLLAESGVRAAVTFIRQKTVAAGYTSLLDPWAAQPVHLEAERGSIDIVVEEESGKLPLGRLVAPNGTTLQPDVKGMAERLLEQLQLPREVVPAVADWIDADDEQRGEGGAESPYYRGLQPPHGAANAPLETVEELRLVKGMTPEAFGKLQPLVTVYGSEASEMETPKININTAPKEVLASLPGVTPELAARIMEQRKTTPFRSAGEVTRVPGMESAGIGLQTRITVKGSLFRIRSTGKSGDTPRTVEAVVRITGGSETYLYWREF